MRNLFKRICRFFATMENLLASVLGVVLGVAASIWWMTWHVRDMAKETVLSPEVIAEVLKEVRPVMVIDTKRRITADYGGSAKFEDIEFKFGSNRTTIEVELRLKTHTQIAPMIRPMTAAVYLESFERTTLHGWVYTFRTSMQTADLGDLPVGTAATLDTNYPFPFLVEFFP